MNRRFFLNFFSLLFIFISYNSLAELIKRDLIINNSDNEIKIFNVEIADTEDSRIKGLMWREQIPNGTGMLFVWEKEAYRNFWMKNTPSALDILFFDKDGMLINVSESTQPFSLANIQSIRPAKYVLELVAGSSLKFNIYEGSKILNLNNQK